MKSAEKKHRLNKRAVEKLSEVEADMLVRVAIEEGVLLAVEMEEALMGPT